MRKNENLLSNRIFHVQFVIGSYLNLKSILAFLIKILEICKKKKLYQRAYM